MAKIPCGGFELDDLTLAMVDGKLSVVGGTGAGAFVVNITQSGTEYVADKTYAEIEEAYRDGEVVFARKDNLILQLSVMNTGIQEAVFTLTMADSDNTVSTGYVNVYGNGRVTYHEVEVTQSDPIIVDNGIVIKDQNTSNYYRIFISNGQIAIASYTD